MIKWILGELELEETMLAKAGEEIEQEGAEANFSLRRYPRA